MSFSSKFIYGLMTIIGLDLLNYLLKTIAFWDIFKVMWRRL